MRFSYLLAVGLAGVSAFPDIPLKYSQRDVDPELEEIGLDPYFLELEKRADTPEVLTSKNEGNCGFIPCVTFDESQLVSVTGQNAWASPGADEIRGPCPGLNAAANHNYLPRNGIPDVLTTAIGLTQAYVLATDFGAFLAVFASIIAGDIETLTWSIGGPMPFPKVGNLIAPPQGISFSHNKYEGDVSIGREDAYYANGDAHSLNVTRWLRSYSTCLIGPGCTMDKFRKSFTANVFWSIKNNPYYFSPPLAGAIVPPAAYNFVIVFMSNRSKENIQGVLTPTVIKTFFGVTGKGKNLVWNKGQERIPDNWYRRPMNNPYGAEVLGADDAVGWAAYPESLRIGGNTKGVNSYVGADIGALTGGQFNAKDLLKPNVLACLAFQGMEMGFPDELKNTVNDVYKATQLFKKFFAPIDKALGCQPLAKYDASVFTGYKGYYYDPHGKATNY